MRLLFLLICAVIASSTYVVISSEKQSNVAVNNNTRTQVAINETLIIEQIPMKNEVNQQQDSKQAIHESVLASSQGQPLLHALTSFWQQCRHHENCEQLLIVQQSLLSENRYQLLLNFPDNYQEQQRFMGELLISQDTTIVNKIANVQEIRAKVWGENTRLLFGEQDAYYDYRTSLTDTNNGFNETGNAIDFIEEYKNMLQEHHDDLTLFSLNSASAKYEQALQLIPSNMSENEMASIKEQLANLYLTDVEQESIANREEQLNQQNEEIIDYQQALNQLELSLSHERATSKKAMNEQDWQVYKTEKLYTFRLNFFNS
ncbi:hypothetical protein [Colwellia psychrerythraea]|uniref:Chromosome segregation ATPase n=1 Tax=Colwellia psychrerythraea TaxID=28229 RepID=A0A099KTM9_COLPS|nr:hypothetical protein [Colwellia psychrerythraea]KGJ93916.1 hypothetical protein GAB14E_2471 [Colwellia psychrerythraea]